MLDALDLKELRSRRASILDFVGKDLERFGGRLGSEDRIKVEAHLAAIRAIEQQNSADSGASCMPPSMVADLDPGQFQNVPDLFRMQMDMMVAALACDQTRVITFHMDSQGDGGRWSWMGPEFQEPGDTYPDRSHHDITHHENDDEVHGLRKTLAEQWYMQQLAYLIGRLKAVPEGTGTLLDHTAVMYINQMGSGSGHHTNKQPDRHRRQLWRIPQDRPEPRLHAQADPPQRRARGPRQRHGRADRDLRRPPLRRRADRYRRLTAPPTGDDIP